MHLTSVIGKKLYIPIQNFNLQCRIFLRNLRFNNFVLKSASIPKIVHLYCFEFLTKRSNIFTYNILWATLYISLQTNLQDIFIVYQWPSRIPRLGDIKAAFVGLQHEVVRVQVCHIWITFCCKLRFLFLAALQPHKSFTHCTIRC